MSVSDKLLDIDRRLKEVVEEIERLKALQRKLITAKENLLESLEQNNVLTKGTQWEEEIFPWSRSVREKMRLFGIESFRSQQLETINITMSKLDVILIAATGSGKSLCFQIPAICDTGLTLVVSPLIALMEDQVYTLKKRGIHAELLSSSTDQDTVKKVHKILNDSGFSSQLKLLYVTPERMAKSKRLMSALQNCYQSKKLERIAIDEVHCCSILGHDFRPDFKYLGTLKTLFPSVPIIGVTATASRKVLTDVQKILNIRGCIILTSPFNRPNLFYHVLEKPSESEALYDLIAELLKNRYANQSGIIYTFSIKDTETLVSELLQRDCKVRPYHASLEANQRTNVYQKWMSNEIQAVVATIAFGLGIDKPNVRFIIHHTMSKSMENYYQESGRAGRDGNYAECLMLYKFSDIFKISSMTFVETNGLRNVYSMIDYCNDAKICRRDKFSNCFAEVWNENSCGKMCDHCFYNNPTAQRSVVLPTIDIHIHYRTLLKIIDKALMMDIRLTGLKLINVWLHKGPSKLRLERIPPPSIDRFFAEQIVAFLITKDFLREDFHYTAYSTISYILKGQLLPETDELEEFQPSRIYDLPKISLLKDCFESTTCNNASSAQGHKPLEQKKNSREGLKKRRISIGSDESCEDSSKLEKLIDKKLELKLQKILGETSKCRKIAQNDDVIVLTPKKESFDVIEID